jgi:hypothetical protein
MRIRTQRDADLGAVTTERDIELRQGRTEGAKVKENYDLAEERYGIEAVSRARGVAWEVTRHRCIDEDANMCFGDMDAIVSAAIGTLLRVGEQRS